MTEKKRDIDAIAGERWFPKESTIIDDMKELWGDWGVSSEVDTLKAVLMRRPGKEIENFDWQAARFKSAIDPERFRAQHDALADIYRAHGVQVHYIEEQREDKPNALFCRDLVLMTPEGAIVTRPGHGSPPRRREICGKGFGGSGRADHQNHLRRRHL